MKHDYSMHVVWSTEDEAYLVVVPELPGCIADGPTPEEAIANARVVINEWILVAKEEGRTVPSPFTKQDLEEDSEKFQRDIRKHIQTEVKNAVNAIMTQVVRPGAGQFPRSKPGSPQAEPVLNPH